MIKSEVVKFLNNNAIAYIATSSNNIPTVRVMQILEISEHQIVFNTKQFKQSYRDLKENPNIEICFYNHDTYEQIRVYGQVEEIEELEYKKEIVVKYPQLKNLVDEKGINVIVPFKIENWQYKLAGRH
jgi:uncharacterized pyridoxamine 5'-phosphate oxidase family protein